MLAQDGGKFMPVDVELGGEGDGLTEIRKGLAVGQKVVVSGQFLVDSEASLRGTATRMTDVQAPEQDKAAALHHGQGKVEQIGKDDITISHGPIASLQWGPMTMPFKLPPAGLPRNVSTGDQVAFDIKQRKDGSFEIAAISPTADAPSVGNKPMTDSMKGDMKMPKPAAGDKK
jgi:Cu(I)/Ag(I) efflux system membrane fusion protein